MSNVLIFSDTLAGAKELRSAADEVFGGSEVKVLCFDKAWSAQDYPLGDTFVFSGIESLCDAGQVASMVKEAAEKLSCTVILLSSNRFGKELAGRLSQKMGIGALTGVTALTKEGDEIIASRLSLGGAVVEKDKVLGEGALFAIAPKSYAESAAVEGTVEAIDLNIPEVKVVLKEVRAKEAGSVDISQAEFLVVAGRGVECKEDLAKLEKFADSMEGALGCSKPMATDRKWFSEDRIVGVSGKTVKPDLALLFGVSGQVQFWAGIRDAGVIVAINNDENAEIVNMADYSVIVDWSEGLNSLSQALVSQD